MGALWHPFSNMSAVERTGEFTLTRGQGVYVYDAEGKRYLDATAGLWFANVGHGRVELAEASAKQIARLASYSIFGDYSNEPAEALAEKLAGLAPVPGCKVFLTSGGSDSVDTAAKLARRYWVEVGQPSRTVLINRDKAYHGMHYAGTALAGLAANRDGYGDLVPDTATVAWDSADDLRATIERIGPDRVAAFYCEPVIGAGGVFPPPEGYLADVRKVCTEYDVLFVADEVVTGYGRIGGSWFASSRFGLEPDIVTTAKGLQQRLPADRRGAGGAEGRRSVLPPRRPGVVATRVHLLRPRRRGSRRPCQPGHRRARGSARRGRPPGDVTCDDAAPTCRPRPRGGGPVRSRSARCRPAAGAERGDGARGDAALLRCRDPRRRRRWNPDLAGVRDDRRRGGRARGRDHGRPRHLAASSPGLAATGCGMVHAPVGVCVATSRNSRCGRRAGQGLG